jgi:NitT/TauT family transport system substrate-binding protein
MFTKNEIDAAWAPEPWATRLVRESGGIRLIDERDLWKDKSFSTTNIIANTKIIQNRPDLVKKFITAHLEVIDWINTHPEEAQTLANTEVAKLTSGKLSGEVIKEAWQMLNFTPDPIILSVQTFAKWAIDEGFIEEKNSDLDNLFFLNILNETANSKY